MLPEGDVWTALDSQPDPPAISFIPGYIQDVESSLSSFIRFEGADADLELPSTPPAAVLESDHCQIHDELYVNTHKRRKTLLQLPTAVPRFFCFGICFLHHARVIPSSPEGSRAGSASGSTPNSPSDSPLMSVLPSSQELMGELLSLINWPKKPQSQKKYVFSLLRCIALSR
jgi:hypothetical protein